MRKRRKYKKVPDIKNKRKNGRSDRETGGGGVGGSVRLGARTETGRKKYMRVRQRKRRTVKDITEPQVEHKRKEKLQASPPGSLPWPLGQTELKI